MWGVAAVQALTGVTVGRARTATLARSAPAPSPPVSSRAAPRCTPIGPSQDRRGLSIFPPSSSPPQPETRTGSPSHRPTFRASPALPDTASPPFLPNRSFWAASGSRARPFGRRWKGTGRGGPGTPPERSREAGTRGRGGANLLGAALPWQRGGGRRVREEARRRGMWCCRGRHRSCRCLLVAASSQRRLLEAAGSSCSLCHIVSSPSRPRLPAAAAELTVSPEQIHALHSRRCPPSALRPCRRLRSRAWRAARAAGAGRGARRRLSRDAPGHFCPVRNWRRRGGLPSARLGLCVGSLGVSN